MIQSYSICTQQNKLFINHLIDIVLQCYGIIATESLDGKTNNLPFFIVNQ